MCQANGMLSADERRLANGKRDKIAFQNLSKSAIENNQLKMVVTNKIELRQLAKRQWLRPETGLQKLQMLGFCSKILW